MIRVRQIKVEVDKDNETYLKEKIIKKLKINNNDLISYEINKKSIDARNKREIYYVYEIDVILKNEEKVKKDKDIFKVEKEEYIYPKVGNELLTNRPVVVGSGPSGLFCAYLLSELGYNPIVIERGEKIEDRIKTVNEFWEKGILNQNSNVCFGEGGAGTFSDGKLNTLVNDEQHRIEKIFDVFIHCGAPKEIKYINKPHIGTDILRKVIVNLRNKIIKNGGEFRYNTTLTDIVVENNKINKIIINNKEELNCEVLLLAIGHSARDTIKMLYNHKMDMTSKPFAVGVRIQHKQEMINNSQYGKFSKLLPNASYKLTYKANNGRGVYTFCMCPGGFVVNSSCEKDHLIINGMSNYERNEENANSAVVVTVGPSDFGNSPLDGLEFQRELENRAGYLGKGEIPTQLYKDYKNNMVSKEFKSVNPLFKGKYTFANLNELFPDFINESLKEGIEAFDKKIKGFASDDAILSGVESRTSSAVRINRNELYESSINGIYPIGEGAGYSGGITTSAIDGLKVAEKIIEKYKSLN